MALKDQQTMHIVVAGRTRDKVRKRAKALGLSVSEIGRELFENWLTENPPAKRAAPAKRTAARKKAAASE